MDRSQEVEARRQQETLGRASMTMFGRSVQGFQKEDPVVPEGYFLSDENSSWAPYLLRTTLL